MVNISSGSGHLLWLPKQNGLTLSLDGSHQSELRGSGVNLDKVLTYKQTSKNENKSSLSDPKN